MVTSIIAAVIGLIGSLTSAFVVTRHRGPAGVPPTPHQAAQMMDKPAPISLSLWLGLSSLVLWLVPLLGYLVSIPGLYIGIREQMGPRRYTATAITLCGLGLVASIVNSAWGIYLSRHGHTWW
jgi:hypothetical protein